MAGSPVRIGYLGHTDATRLATSRTLTLERRAVRFHAAFRLPSIQVHPETKTVAGGSAIAGTITIVGASHTDNTGPILAFVGALIVVFVTAYSTRKRQEDALEAEASRLDRQLEHDRRLRDVADLREVLENAMATVEGSLVAIAKRRETKQRHGDIDDHIEEIDKATTALLAAFARMKIRLRPDDPLTTAHAQLVGALNQVNRYALKLDKQSEFEQANDAYIAARDALVNAANTRVGSRTD